REGRAPQQVVSGHDQARRAEAALDGPTLQESVLDRVQAVPVREALDRRHPAALGLAREHEAGADQGVVEVDRAGPALALLARVLGAGQAHALAQDVEQALALPGHVDLSKLAVDRALEPHVTTSSRYS